MALEQIMQELAALAPNLPRSQRGQRRKSQNLNEPYKRLRVLALKVVGGTRIELVTPAV